MSEEQNTRKDFNKMITDAFGKASNVNLVDTSNKTKFKQIIFEQLLGAGTFISKNGGDLIKTIEDASTGGLKAININKRQIQIIYKNITELNNDPNLKLTVRQIYDIIISNIIGLQAATLTIIIDRKDRQKRVAELEEWAKENLLRRERRAKAKIIEEKIKTILDNIVESKRTYKFKKIKDFTEKIQKFAGAGTITAAGFGVAFHVARELWGKIPILLGPVPIRNVHYVEVARSGKVLKFRATGSVFLARQEGGDQSDAIKIEGILYKADFGVMFLLWGLFLYGQSKFKNLDDIVGPQGSIGTVVQLRKMNDILVSDTSLQRPSYEFHRTFPFVSKHFIIPNCYIETISIEDKLPLKDVLKYTILLRTYKKPMGLIRYVKASDENIYMIGSPKKTVSSQVCQYSLTTSWRLFNAYGWMIDEMEWRIGSAKSPGVLDTYYDIDPTSIATVAYLSLMGALV